MKKKYIYKILSFTLMSILAISNVAYAKDNSIVKKKPGNVNIGTDKYNGSTSSSKHKPSKGSSHHSKLQRSEWEQMVDSDVSETMEVFRKNLKDSPKDLMKLMVMYQ